MLRTRVFPTKIKTMKTNTYLENIYEASKVGDDATDPYRCVEQILEKIEAVGLRNGTIKIIDGDHGWVGREDEALSDRLRGGIIERVARKGRPLIAALDGGERVNDGNGSYLICVPVRYGHDTMAVLAAEHQNVDEDVLEKDLQFLSVLSSLLVVPVQRIQPSSDQKGVSLSAKKTKLPLTRLVENFERELIVAALKKTLGNQTKAAALLGVSLRIINYRIGKLNLDYRRFRKVN